MSVKRPRFTLVELWHNVGTEIGDIKCRMNVVAVREINLVGVIAYSTNNSKSTIASGRKLGFALSRKALLAQMHLN